MWAPLGIGAFYGLLAMVWLIGYSYSHPNNICKDRGVVTERMIRAGATAIAEVAAKAPNDQDIEITWSNQANAAINAALNERRREDEGRE